MSDDTSRKPGDAKIQHDRLPTGDLFKDAPRNNVPKIDRSARPPIPPPPITKKVEAPKTAPPDPTEVVDLDLLDEEMTPVTEEVPELPAYSDELVRMVEEALPEIPATALPRSLRAPTLPPPPRLPPRLESLRKTLPGYPPLPPAEGRISRPDALPEEVSGRRVRLAEPATVDHVNGASAAHLEETKRVIAGLEERIMAHVTEKVDGLRDSLPPPAPYRSYSPLREPVGFEPPPSRMSWLASIGKGVAAKVKGWFAPKDIVQKEAAESPLQKTIRLVEEAERSMRDLPTVLLAGKTFDQKSIPRAALEASTERWRNTAATLQRQPSSTIPDIETRKSTVLGARGKALQTLLESDRGPLLDKANNPPPEAVERFADFEKSVLKKIQALERTRASEKDRIMRMAAELSLQKLRTNIGGASAQGMAEHIRLTCEAALRIPLADVDAGTKNVLSHTYDQRLELIQNALGLSGEPARVVSDIRDTLTRYDARIREAA